MKKTPKPSRSEPTISRTGVYGIVWQNQKLLVVKQQKGPHLGKFDLPGGGIEAGETIEEALRREFREEVGMSFDSIQLIENLTAVTEGLNENGAYFLHQIGLIYLIHGFFPLQNAPEIEFFWIEPQELSKAPISPFVKQMLHQLKLISEETCFMGFGGDSE